MVECILQDTKCRPFGAKALKVRSPTAIAIGLRGHLVLISIKVSLSDTFPFIKESVFATKPQSIDCG